MNLFLALLSYTEVNINDTQTPLMTLKTTYKSRESMQPRSSN